MDYSESLREIEAYDLMWTELGRLLNAKKESDKVSAVKVKWANSQPKRNLYFTHLNANDAFRIKGHSAVYIKVIGGRSGVLASFDGAMMEVATGKLFAPTSSEIEPVDVEINIGVAKPHIY